MSSRNLNVTDGRTDGQTTCRRNTALCVPSRAKNRMDLQFIMRPVLKKSR